MKLSPPQLIKLPPIRLIGLKRKMSLAENTAPLLLREFMTQRKRIKNTVNEFIHDMRVYPIGLNWQEFTIHTQFTKWVGVEVGLDEPCPDGFETYDCTGGLYVHFEHIGPASESPEAFAFIMTEWLPKTNLQLDNRPHLDRMGPGYDPTDPNAKEEIWIPLQTD